MANISDIERESNKVLDLLRNLEKKGSAVAHETAKLKGNVRRDYRATVRAIREIGEQEIPWMRYSLKTTEERIDDLLVSTKSLLGQKGIPDEVKTRASSLERKLKAAQSKTSQAAKAYDRLLSDFNANSAALYRDVEAMASLSSATGAAGAAAGSIGGAAVGSLVPGAGTAAGLIVGAGAGGLAGAVMGRTLAFINLLSSRAGDGYGLIKAVVSIFYPVTVFVEWVKRIFGADPNLQAYR